MTNDIYSPFRDVAERAVSFLLLHIPVKIV